MDLSVQKMQPPASVQGKSAAKRSARSGTVTEDSAVESAERDQKTRFVHGNTGYEQSDKDEQAEQEAKKQAHQTLQHQAQLLSGEDLSQLALSVEQSQADGTSADGLMNLRAYQSKPTTNDQEEEPQFDKNI